MLELVAVGFGLVMSGGKFMNSWLIEASPLLNFFLFFILVFNAMANGPGVTKVSNLLFMILFANIIVSAILVLM